MFEHLDDPRQHEHDLVAEYGTVAALSAAHRRRRSITVTTLALSLVVTGGVSGLALGGPDSVHAPIGKGPLLAIGDPRSTSADRPLPALVASDRINANGCPSAADPGHPTAFAAAAVAVAGPLVLRSGSADSGWDTSASYPAVDTVAPPRRTGGASSPSGASGTDQASVSGAVPGGAPHPPVQSHPTTPTTPAPAPTDGGGGGQLPGLPSGTPTPTPPVTTGTGDPGDPGSGGTVTGTPDPSPDPSGSPGSGDPGSGASDGPTPIPSDPGSNPVDQLPAV